MGKRGKRIFEFPELEKINNSWQVKKDLFYDLIARKGNTLIKDAQGRMQFRDAATLDEFKHRMAHKYAISDISTIITYDEMMKHPLGTAPHWNVLVWSGHGDDSATRRDVIGTYLLVH